MATTTFGNGASSTWAFNANALYRLSQLQTFGQGGTTIQNINYTYDPVGNITQIANVANTNAYNVTNFSYDQLNRLITASTTPVATASATTSIAIMDAIPIANRQSSAYVTSDAFMYAVPTGGGNKLLVVLLAMGSDKSASLAATQNGTALTCQKISGSITRAYHFYCYLASPASGTFSISWSGGTVFQYSIFTLQNAAQSSPIDVSNVTDLTTTGTSLSTNVTTTQGNDLLLDNDIGTGNTVTYSFGTGQTGIFSGSVNDVLGRNTASYKPAASSAGTETMTRTYSPNDNNDDLVVVAVKQLTASTSMQMATSTPYRQSFTYDWLGNLLSVTNGATSSAGTPPSIMDTLPLSFHSLAAWHLAVFFLHGTRRRLEQTVRRAHCSK